MAKKYLDYDGLVHFWGNLKAYFVADVTYNSSSKKIQKTKGGSTSDVVTLSTVATSGSYSDLSNKPTIPSAGTGTSYPAMDGTRSLGSSDGYARVDHVHPTDTSRAASNHAHGNISNNGTLQTTDVDVANGDKLVVTDSSASGAVVRTSVAFDGSTTTKALTPKGTWADFVPPTRRINGNALSADVSLSAGDFEVSGDTQSAVEEIVPRLSSPDIDTVIGEIAEWGADLADTVDGKANSADLATVATSGSYNDLTNKPTIPTLKNVFGIVKVGSTNIQADTTQDTLELVAGTNVTLTPDATNDKVTIAATDTTYSDATTSASGLMSASDKTKLNGIAAGAEVNVNADWNALSGDAQILNKPTLGAAAAKGVVTSITGDSANLPTVTAVRAYVESAVTGAAAFQGTAPTSFAPTNYKKGYYWVVGTAGTYAGQVCEAGDMIFCITDYGSAYSASDFDVIQTNLDITAITNAEIDTIMAA